MPPYPQPVEVQRVLASTNFHENLKSDEPHIKRFACIALHYWCYALHGFLLILQIVLLAMLWSHPERNITIAFDNSVLTIGLSACIQAFYALYTALLVFATRRLALTDFLSRPQKLTATHDVSAAWAGLGAATATLWRQTKIAASTWTTLLVFFYLSCISILHIASSTIMVFEPYNATSTTAVPSNSSWPDQPINLTTLNMNAVAPLVPIMSSLTGLSTDGLINTTVYDTFSKTPQMVNASVNANTVQASCGLLPNLTYAVVDDIAMINVSMSGVGEVSYVMLSPPSYHDVFLLSTYGLCTQCRNDALVYLVSTPMDIDNSVVNNVSLDIVWDGGSSRNISITVYMVACSLEVSNYTYDLEISNERLQPTMGQPDPSSQGWPLWTPPTNDLGAQLNLMVSSAFSASTQCGGCSADQTMDDYLGSLLGINVSANTTASITLTPYQFENAVSQIAAELIWIAGQLSEEGGGFSPTASVAQVIEQTSRWRLNIQTIPVLFTSCASFILLMTVCLLLGVPSKRARHLPPVEGVTLLEMLWIGAQTSDLRKRLQEFGRPSLDELRSRGMFHVDLIKDLWMQENKTSEKMLSLNPGFCTLEFEVATQGTRSPDHRHGAQRRSRTFPFINLSRRFSCYLLHVFFILLHIILLFMVIHHLEHRIVLQSASEVFTTALAVSLQLFYVTYTLILVFITQRLAASRAVARKQSLTRVHDVSQAWTSIGSALLGLWQQAKAAASVRMTIAIATYYLCVSVLHVTSTTVMQFEVFSTGQSHISQSIMAWPGSFGNTTYEWDVLSAIVPLGQLPSLSANGLLDNTVYDTPIVDSTSVNATVNATTIHADCGLLSNLSLDFAGQFPIVNATIPNVGPITIFPFPTTWKDTVTFMGSVSKGSVNNLTSTCPECDGYLLYWVTTALNVDDSLGDVSISTNWTFTPPGENTTLSNTTAYLVACSLSTTTSVEVLDVQTDLLSSTTPQLARASPESWPLWSPGGMTPLGVEISTALSFSNHMGTPLFENATFSHVDAYTMSLLGINLTANVVASATQSSANPSVTLSPSQFEDAISQIAAQFIWAAGHTNGNFGPAYGTGESIVTDLVVLWRLNVNTIPAMIASVASVLLFILSIYMVGVDPSTASAITELGVLESLWLEAHLEVLHERMLQVKNPTLHNLRVAGMFDVCLADEVREVLEKSA